MSRLLHPNLKEEDCKRPGFPRDQLGNHNLRAWGFRLGEHKGDYGVDAKGEHIPGIWDVWTPEMQTYMDQDVVVNHRLLQYLKPWEYPQVPLDLEHRAAEVCHHIQMDGWPFDIPKAQALYTKLVSRREELEKLLIDRFGSWQEVDKVLIPKRDNRTLGYIKGVPVTKYKTVTFNPGSRQHIIKKLKEYGWEPEEFTDAGQAKVDESVLEKIDLPEAVPIVEYLLVQKRLGQLGDGDNAWLKLVDTDGRMHGAYNPCGTVTGRSSHFKPNISQVPSMSKPYGEECRELFHVPKGWKQIGADMAGLELRTFAHFLAAFDNGEYAKVVVAGDPHWFHTCALGLYPVGTVYDPDNHAMKAARNKKSKTWIYAWLYGAGAKKLALILKSTVSAAALAAETFLKRIPAIAKLKSAVARAAAKGWLKGMDGRRMHCRSEHSALNTLLQGAGALLCKQWLCDFADAMEAAGYKRGWDGDFVILGHIHDELQVAVRERYVSFDETTRKYTSPIADILVACARSAGEPYGFKVPLDSDYVIGDNWKDCH